ncbi:hypothetical protein [Endozoicomonas sp. ALD040]|uniref:hypothetical protein n=1 Tax=Endozoicomonas sp. ALD040 TaxID=3403079 RepID=UPI003BAEB4CB
MTDKPNLNDDLEQSIKHLMEVFSREFGMDPTMSDLAGLMLAKEVSLMTLALDRIEGRLNELIEPLRIHQPTETEH